ncbi:MAG TPA: M14 family zinc carboxypeptidase [Bacteriovoracaceae bacterium]|nr:M14 family zinc carboxypeptidase [Bacteriovoracaceae bacterium]
MNTFPELDELLSFKQLRLPQVRFEVLGSVSTGGREYPIQSLVIGAEDKSLPTFGLFGGVHGLEKVGSQIIIAFLKTFFHQLSWDQDLVKSLEQFRIVSIPIINPGGMANSTRCNPSGVDLMRNAPVEADAGLGYPLISGHRLSPRLPWYRGQGAELELESKVLVEFVREQMFHAELALCLDVHSGFGVKDQIWYPYARSKKDYPFRPQTLKLKELLDTTYPHHIYKFEGQADNYITSGDLWDFLLDEYQASSMTSATVFLPLTLELGSWNWIRKNPVQFFSKLGLFHPMKQHRHSRIMRRHLLLLDLLIRAVKNHKIWMK